MPSFAQRVLRWHAAHGRHDLPWQEPRSAYRVWVSEIMLQQTTVATVTGYFARFMERFPDVDTLAEAPLDDVLSLWQGLGYYARARNLHATAKIVRNEHAGEFPLSRDELEKLPGIGRSTAAAICAQAFDQCEAILDANVRRLLCRHGAVTEWPGKSAVQKALWELAESRLPERARPGEMPSYTQGAMDLGANVCKPRKPDCAACPVSDDCLALAHDMVEAIPARNPRRIDRPHRHCHMWIERNPGGDIWLVRRPATGIWGGLWCLPQSEPGLKPLTRSDLPPLKHTFSHFDLTIHPLLECSPHHAVEDQAGKWVSFDKIEDYGLPTPVRRILATLRP